jgi:thiamine biosynthesis lipoprotein
VIVLHRVLVLTFAALLAAGCSRPPSSGGAEPAPGPDLTRSLATRSGLAMGSQLTLTAFTRSATDTDAAFDAVLAEFERLDAVLSVWRPGSDVLRINAAAGERPVAVGRDALAALLTARQVSDWTHGKFDVTFGALTDVWRFDHDQDGRVPTADEIARRRPLIGYSALQIDEAAGTAFLSRPGMRIHLGGIGKGYAVERAARLLHERGVHDFMIQSGGDLYVAGLREGRPWRLGIADPRQPTRVFGTLEVHDGTLSTSGDYERSFVKDGVRYHHLLDPDTGMPARGCRSVTIVASRPAIADGLSTGVFILGPSEGMALVERLPDVEAVIVTDRNDVLVSSGLMGTFQQIEAPTDGP